VNDYAVARVRAMRCRLLGRRGLLDLLGQPDLTARLELLRRTGHAAGGAHTPHDVARALRARLARDSAAIAALFADTRHGRLLRAVGAIFDGWVLAAVLRGVEHSEPPAQLLSLLTPTAELDDAALRELVAQRSVRDVVALLATWGSRYAAPLEDAMPRKPRVPDPLALELALERFRYADALSVAAHEGAEGRLVTSLVRSMIDFTNATTLLKIAGHGAPSELFVPGGRALSLARFTKLAALPAHEAEAAIAADRALRLGPAFSGGRLDPFRVEGLITARLRAALARPAREEPLSVAVPLLYLIDRREELRAIRVVLEGTELGLPASELADLVEVV
jgi:vacuolar-type H+-ATPase subunit C/Vma6